MLSRKEIGERLLTCREKAGKSRAEVSKIVNVGTTTLRQWEVGATEASIETIGKLANLYMVSPHYLIFGDIDGNDSKPQATANTEKDAYVYIPAYDIAVSAGHGMFSDGVIKPHKYLAFRRDWISKRGLDPKCLAVLFNDGDSMDPTIPDKSAMVINREQDKALDGQVCVIRIDDRLYVKRTQWIPTGGIRLISDNKAYDTFDITKEDLQASDIEVCGQVIHVSHDIA